MEEKMNSNRVEASKIIDSSAPLSEPQRNLL
jgi:hypothetical protein